MKKCTIGKKGGGGGQGHPGGQKMDTSKVRVWPMKIKGL